MNCRLFFLYLCDPKPPHLDNLIVSAEQDIKISLFKQFLYMIHWEIMGKNTWTITGMYSTKKCPTKGWFTKKTKKQNTPDCSSESLESLIIWIHLSCKWILSALVHLVYIRLYTTASSE